MKHFDPSDLKSILHSKRTHLFYLEHCRVMMNGGRVEYVTEHKKKSQYFNIPIANTSCILLGTGTSVTQAAVRELAKAGVMLGFCGGGGTPLFATLENDYIPAEETIEWFSPQSEYRPTEYLQHWVSFWFDDTKRLAVAKVFQQARIEKTQLSWKKNTELSSIFNEAALALQAHALVIEKCDSSMALLAAEGRLTKLLYKLVSDGTGYGDFTRTHQSNETANNFLDQGNYLAYGLAATATWTLGLPHGLSVLHGKTRRGGLVFDVADLIKDAIVLPQAFISAVQGDDSKQFREACLHNFSRYHAMDFMFDTLKSIVDSK